MKDQLTLIDFLLPHALSEYASLNQKLETDYPNVWKYMQNLFQEVPSIKELDDAYLEAMKKSS